ncbi:MAG: hypothetical protein GY952_15365 [Rhodobacteraceae bacterium]|nr:hypothetical protein [Paracoccaceae bacterium]
MEVWSALTVDQRLTVWIAVGSALLGGSVSLLTSWVMSRQANVHSEKMRNAEVREGAASRAQEAFVNLLQLTNAAYSLKEVIDGQFSAADEEGLAHLLPVQKVQEIIAVGADLEPFLSRDITFLLHSDDAELLGDLLVYEKRVHSLQHAIGTYNEKRADLTARFEQGALKIGSESDTLLSSELEGKDALLADVRVSVLQGLLGQIMERLEREVNEGHRLLGRFQNTARNEFKELYPNLKFEVPNATS